MYRFQKIQATEVVFVSLSRYRLDQIWKPLQKEIDSQALCFVETPAHPHQYSWEGLQYKPVQATITSCDACDSM